MPAFPYRKVLIVGATSGIGLGLATKLVQEGVSVVVVGRRQDRLDSFVKSHSSASAVRFDIGDIQAIPAFADSVVKAHPDLDCVVLNAGIQYVMDMSKPDTVNVDKIQQEFKVNYISYVALTQAFMKHLQSLHDRDTALVYTTSSLATIPYPMIFNYSASKAALRSFILSLREQLKASKSPIHVMELYAPLVQTDLHFGQPGWADDFNVGMPVEDFVVAAVDGIIAKNDTTPIGFTKPIFEKFEKERETAVGPAWERIKGTLGSAHQL